MKQILRLLCFCITVIVLPAIGQTTASKENGRAVFNQWCIHCHGEMDRGPLPGTFSLGIKYEGALPALLEERTDLAPEFIRIVVRGGLFGMPITRKTEVSDSDLEDIIAYLTRNQ
jgi:mono/diheme cytochrome c family protein